MKKTRRPWIALLLGALLLTTLVGAVWARPQSSPATHDTAHKLDRPKAHHAGFHYTITIPGAAFHPAWDGLDWQNWGWQIYLSSGEGRFTTVVPMLPGNRTVESMTMYVKDNNGSVNACVYLDRTKTDGAKAGMAQTCSVASSGSIRSFTDTSISPSTIWGGHGAYLELYIGGTGIDVYAVQIKYY